MAAAKHGTLTVDFAGTREEARQLVTTYPGLHLAQSPAFELAWHYVDPFSGIEPRARMAPSG